MLTYHQKYYLKNRKRILASNRKWRTENREKFNRSTRLCQRKCRLEVLRKYGGRCTCCGESKMEFLAIDHIYGRGKKHRSRLGRSGTRFYFYLKKLGYPRKSYQILCHNCNLAKGFYGKCPHQVRHSTSRAKNINK